MHDSGWSHFADESNGSKESDNHVAILPKKQHDKGHLLCFWHLSDTKNFLTTMSKDMSVDCDGRVAVDDTQSAQNKRKKTVEIEKEVEEKCTFRGDLISSMKPFAIAQVEDNLWKTQNEAVEHEPHRSRKFAKGERTNCRSIPQTCGPA